MHKCNLPHIVPCLPHLHHSSRMGNRAQNLHWLPMTTKIWTPLLLEGGNDHRCTHKIHVRTDMVAHARALTPPPPNTHTHTHTHTHMFGATQLTRSMLHGITQSFTPFLRSQFCVQATGKGRGRPGQPSSHRMRRRRKAYDPLAESYHLPRPM